MFWCTLPSPQLAWVFACDKKKGQTPGFLSKEQQDAWEAPPEQQAQAVQTPPQAGSSEETLSLTEEFQ